MVQYYDLDRSARDSFGPLAPKVFHSVENFFPRLGKNGLIFPRYGKILAMSESV